MEMLLTALEGSSHGLCFHAGTLHALQRSDYSHYVITPLASTPTIEARVGTV